jgi:hypothetical protein
MTHKAEKSTGRRKKRLDMRMIKTGCGQPVFICYMGRQSCPGILFDDFVANGLHQFFHRHQIFGENLHLQQSRCQTLIQDRS